MSREEKGLLFKGKIYLRVVIRFPGSNWFFLEMMCSFNYTLLKYDIEINIKEYSQCALQTSTRIGRGGVKGERHVRII